MKKLLFIFVIALCTSICQQPVFAASEKDFTDAYKKAFESKDEAGLKALLYTKGSDPEIVEFFTMMMTGDMGAKLSSIELRDLTPEEVKKAAEVQPSPSGGEVALLVKPTKKLVLKMTSSDASGNSSGSSETFVAEVDGKYLIPVPGPVKK